MSGKFKLVAPFKPSGDQPAALDALCAGVRAGKTNQTLLGVTGSGKTFTVAAMIERLQLPALVISPNKVLAAQLYSEFKTFFPENAVEYFVSYYDYYQPEAYIPSTDTFIEKDASINDHIDKLRLKATTSILTRPDTIVVASVSCIYGIGSPDNFSEMCLNIRSGQKADRRELTRALVDIHYERNELEFERGTFRLRGPNLDIFPADSETAWRVELGDTVESIKEIDPLTGEAISGRKEIWIFPATHFVSAAGEAEAAAAAIEAELSERLAELKIQGKLLEAERLGQRVRYDLEMIRQTGYCNGVENYSRHLAGRPAGSRPDCLFDYFSSGARGPGRQSAAPAGPRGDGRDFLLFIDESHVTVPQIRGMYAGDRSRKQTLVDFGFRLPSALDNRPLKFDEFEALRPSTVFVSATPGPYELGACAGDGVVEQIIRPTGLVDPEVKILPVTGQIKALTAEIEIRAAKKERTLVLTLTKKTAEDLSAYLTEKGLKARYMHSSMDTLERLDVLGAFRKGGFDALVGINLLREGLDIPEVTLVAILNADNEGFLRSETTLIQISGRAARNLCGEVILFADRMTGSMERAMAEMKRRRDRQQAYNKKYGIEPRSIIKKFVEFEELRTQAKRQGILAAEPLPRGNMSRASVRALAEEVERRMKEAADNLNFELATELRDRLFEIREMAGIKAGTTRSKKK